MSHFAPFTYCTLPSPSAIRLIEFVDEIPQGLIRITFTPFMLDRIPALSYTWSNPVPDVHLEFDDKLPILCNGGLLEVGRNLHQALILLYKA